MTDEIKQELLTIKKQMNLYISKILNKPISIPDHAYFTLTNRCNLKCVMCDIRKHPPKKLSDELTTNEIKKSIDEISEMGINHVIFSGGEPLLRKDIFELIKYSTNKVKQISLITNGLNIKKELAKRIVNSGITQITFSLDGTEKIHNNIRGSNDSYNNIIDSIKLIKLYRKKKPSIGINFTIMNSNFKNMIKILELAEKNDCDNIVFQPVMENNTDMKAQFKNKSFAVSKKNIISLKKIKEAIENLKQIKHKTKLLINTVITKKNYFELSKILEFAKQNSLNSVTFLGLSYNPNNKLISSLLFKKEDEERFNQVVDRLIMLKRNGPRIQNSIKELKNLKKYYFQPEETIKKNPCNLKNRLYVFPDGTTYSCSKLPTLGNIQVDSIKKLLKQRKEIIPLSKQCKEICMLPCTRTKSLIKRIVEVWKS